MGRHRQPKMHTHACSLCRSSKHEHTQTQTRMHARTHAAEGLRSVCWCDTVGWLVCWTRGSEREREMAFVISPSSPFFLPLTVRWMIAITGTISETKWRSMGQRDTAMGIQPSDYCAALPWERRAVYLSGGFVVSYAFSFLFHPANIKACSLKGKTARGPCEASVYGSQDGELTGSQRVSRKTRPNVADSGRAALIP